MWPINLPPTRWLWIALALPLAACARAPETARPPAGEPTAFDAIVRQFPYRAPPKRTASGSLCEIASAPVPGTNHSSTAPVSLTTSDGAGLEVTKLDARVVVDSMLAFTELRLSFRNPLERVREGRFTLKLPPGAAISRLAMKVDGSWQEAEVVERRDANRVYEDFLHQRQDPALLEKKAGNEFAARVFPIAPLAEKEIIIAYSEELEQQEYRLPLAGMPRIKELSVRAQVLDEPGRSALLGPRTEHLLERNFVPQGDFRVAIEKPFVALTTDNLVAIPIRWTASAKVEPIETLALALDTSASRALDLADDLKRLDELVAELVKLHPEIEFTLLTFDQDVRTVYSGTAKAFDPKLLDRVQSERALGASNLTLALEALDQSGAARAVLFTDAVPTAGALEPASLAPQLRRLQRRGARLDLILSGAAHDRDLAEALVQRGGRVLSAELGATELARRLSLAPAREFVPSLPDAEWIQPTLLEGLEPGAIRTIHARLKHPVKGPVTVTLSGVDGSEARDNAARTQLVTLPTRTGERVLLERSVAGAEIRRVAAELAAPKTPASERATLRGTIVDLSRRYRVLSDYTALLVLETEDDYARSGIDRNALADIISVGDQGLTRVDRVPPKTTGGQALEQLTQEPPRRGAAHRHAKGLGPVPPTPTPNEGYGYEFSDDPLSASLEAEPAPKAYSGEPGLEQICAIDPDACPKADMNRVEQARPTSAVRDVSSRSCRSGPVRRWAGGAPRRLPCAATPSGPPVASPPWSASEFVEPYAGRFAEVMRFIVAGDIRGAEREALAWRDAEPLDTLALVALGEALEAAGRRSAAARAYGSLLDLYPWRADMRRFAAGRLERVGTPGLGLSEDSYRKSLEQRPDHVTSHQLLAYSLLRQGRAGEAFAVLETLASAQGLSSLELREDVRLCGAVLMAREPTQTQRVLSLLNTLGLEPAYGPTVRLLLTWETDTNDVDLHLVDRRGQHAYYQQRALPDRGTLLSDVTSGYGPEEFLLAPDLAGAPYQVFVNYYASGPMGFGMGKVDVIAHDGKGNVSFDTRPFVISNENATVHLGQVDRNAFPWLPADKTRTSRSQ